MSTSISTTRTDLAGALSIGAGLVHAAAAGTHGGATTLVWLFAASAIAQVGLGVLVLASPTRRALLANVGVNLVCVGAWIASRTTGISFIADLEGREAVGTQDVLGAALGAVAVVFTLWALVPRPAPTSPRLAWLPALALVPAVFGIAAPHDGHAHAEGEEHAHVEAEEHAHSDADSPAVDPALRGADAGLATDAQQATAVALVDDTRAAVSAAFTDTASATAAGYVWIGDGRRPGRYQHYVNPAYLQDEYQLDPDHVESLVFENIDGTPVLVSTMYLLDLGQTMADVPDVAGELTQWHDHQNLCWDETGTMLAGVSTDGETCRPSGTLRATPPMLHVWLVENPCGPFAGIEGHGSEGAACAPHEH